MSSTPCTLLHQYARMLPLALILYGLAPASAHALPFSFSTGDPDGRIATGSRPSSVGKNEIETGDDFVLTGQTQINHATFTGLLTGGASVSDLSQVAVEVYRVFPSDSNVGRTSGSPVFSTSQVPTRVNSPADVAFDSRDSALGTLSFSTAILGNSFTANNSVLNGINPAPGQATGGEGAVTGTEVLFDVSFSTPFDLAADHYFFVPLVGLNIGDFLWLSAPRPLVPPATPFTPDLQTWIRDADLAPDWLRIGTDIVGGSPAPTFNAAFSLSGQSGSSGSGSVPEPGSLALAFVGSAALVIARHHRPLKHMLAIR